MRFHVLVVDDSPEFLATTGGILADDFDVTTCGSAEEALALDLAPFDTICSDYRMGVMDGLTFLCRVRDTREHAGLLLMTGIGDLDAAEMKRIDAVGAVFVRKPFDPAFLITMVGTLAQTSRLRGLNHAAS